MKIYAVRYNVGDHCLECAENHFHLDLSDFPKIYDTFDDEVTYAHSWEISEDDVCDDCFVKLIDQYNVDTSAWSNSNA